MSSFVCLVIFICLLVTSGSSMRLYTMSNDNKTIDLLTFDTNITKLSITPISSFDHPQQTVLKGEAVVCQNIYHSYWTQPTSYTYPRALFAWDIVRNGPSYYQIDYGHRFVTMGCTSQQEQLLLVDSGEDGNTFELSSIKLFGTEVTFSRIATLPDTSLYSYSFGANIFSFNSDSSELWISLKDVKGGNGVLAIVDTETGNWTQYSYPKDVGSPYFTLPQTLSGGSFKAAIKPQIEVPTLQFVTLHINEQTNTLSLAVDIEDAAYLYGDGLPVAVCEDAGYVIGGQGSSLTAFDINTGKLTAQYFLKDELPNINMGGIACNQR